MENNISVHGKKFELFLEQETIEKRIRLMGIQLNLDYDNKKPVFLAVLNGSFLFMADLMKEIEADCEIEFIKIASYHGQSSTGTIKETIGLPNNLHGRHIVIVEDIVDTGLTIQYVINKIKRENPASIAVCSLLLKPDALKQPVDELNYIGFEIPNEFVVGYGLDYDGLGRNLNHIYRAV